MNEKNSQKEHSSAEQNQYRNNQEAVVINCKKKIKLKCLDWKNATARTFYFIFLSQQMAFIFCYSYKGLRKNNPCNALICCAGMSLEAEEDG